MWALIEFDRQERLQGASDARDGAAAGGGSGAAN